MQHPDYDVLLKLVIVGDSGVGKSSLMIRFADDHFSTNYITTIGVDFKFKTCCLHGKRAKLQIWDTAGQERFRHLCTSYYRGAAGFLICFDTTSEGSFQNVDRWLGEIDRYASENVVKVLVGTKCDMVIERQVAPATAQSLADDHGLAYFETSSKEAVGVEAAFSGLAAQCMEKLFELGQGNPPDSSVIIVRNQSNTGRTSSNLCMDC